MSGQASPTAEDMPANELHENSGARDLAPMHAAHDGIFLPLLPPKAPVPFVAMQPEATPQLF
ncbi:unnamed protein product [Ectocarpus sp. CCAP 1310/34]|nr:unnamed protein product [Ectocarpus sp. CCAP 1310/34]